MMPTAEPQGVLETERSSEVREWGIPIRMREYELKRGTGKILEGDGLRKIAAEVFGDVGTDGAKVIVSYGALEKMAAWTDGKKLFVDTSMKTGVADHIATDTINAYNTFLEKATGLTAKERSKRAQEAAKRGAA